METNPTVSIELPNLRINLSQGMLQFIEFFDTRNPKEVAQSLENVFDLAMDARSDLAYDDLQDLITTKNVFKLITKL